MEQQNNINNYYCNNSEKKTIVKYIRIDHIITLTTTTKAEQQWPILMVLVIMNVISKSVCPSVRPSVIMVIIMIIIEIGIIIGEWFYKPNKSCCFFICLYVCRFLSNKSDGFANFLFDCFLCLSPFECIIF